ncbi:MULTISPECIES: biotin biosynthesis protein BioC [unclassified Shinella]|uniref:biotin biosynthesis protein BioC n=1 Tax=unclassified Shinella TaxID=2643062 RepID=UPI00234E78E2|nr:MULTISPECIES: biotin biosynthesis protein BioC [unclassified Shinella]MCO5140446.1 biotin biosynthesis protein BioC [Shinella sp.]MCW5705732.1 biotin biosynthesis protein BioC [Shinella sp.]MDC7254831.1 biotin biosynthesis protein BioC [Shinella sp. YE25]
MHVSNRIASSSTSDSLAYLATRAAGKAAEENVEAGSTAHLAGGSYDPSAHVGLSVDALLVLSVAREEVAYSQPALTDAERENLDTAALEEREHAAFGRFLEEGDRKAYYRAYIEYFDSMPAEDQRSARYAGTREPAVAALRAIAYNESALDMTAPDAALENATAAGDRAARRATPIAAIFQPSQADFENAARLVTSRISRADAMYATGF